MFHQISGWFLILMAGGESVIPPGTALFTEDNQVISTENLQPLLTEN